MRQLTRSAWLATALLISITACGTPSGAPSPASGAPVGPTPQPVVNIPLPDLPFGVLPVPTPDPLAACLRDPAQVPGPSKGRAFHTCGSRLLDSDGKPVRITGVSWFGLETGTYAPHGLWTRNWHAMLDQIA